jgi:hypothetical protein
MDRQPGQVIFPHDDGPNVNGQHVAASPPPQPAYSSGQPASQVLPAPAPTTLQTPSPVPGAATSLGASDIGWQYAQEAELTDSVQPLPEDVIWTAAEFVEHQKGASWYGALVLAAMAVAASYYLVTRDGFFTGVIVLAAAMFGIYAAHKPRTQQYHLGPQGLQIGERMYYFQSFKNFSVAEEGATASIIFIPLARFAPPLTVYVAKDLEEQVLDYLSLFLPFEQHHTDVIDSLLRRIRF